MKFSYLLDKIQAAPCSKSPFNHIEINHFFNKEDFDEIVTAPEIALPPQVSDEGLFDTLFKTGYKMINFPGCITDKDAYLEWHKRKDREQSHNYTNTSCEGFGVTVRLIKPESKVIADLMDFVNSSELRNVLAKKFGIDINDVYYDSGIQKYLDGYEISPHPDIRKKAATFMVNINPGDTSEKSEHHTHYLKFKDPYKYVQTYWEGNLNKDRCWVPWDWCETKKVQTENNSIVIFSPDNDTMHGVKAKYNHLSYQRTQLYGNLWYHARPTEGSPTWENFLFQQRKAAPKPTLKERAVKKVKRFVKKTSALVKDTDHHKRNKS